MARAYLPESIINRKKQGFPLPLQSWFGKDFIDISKKMLLSKDSKIKVVINQDNLQKWIALNKGSEMFGQKLWMLVSLEMWLREWFPQIEKTY